MPGGLWSRIKTWGKESFYQQDINAEFDNVIANQKPDVFDDYSETVVQMKLMTDPGSAGSESQPTSLAGELERLRFALNRIIGGSNWYEAPAITILDANAQLASAGAIPSSRVVSGRRSALNQPMFLVPDGTAATINLKATTVNVVYYVDGSQYTATADASLSGLSLAPAVGNTCTVNDSSLAGTADTKLQGENGTVITVSSMGVNISNLAGQIAAFKIGSEYFIAHVDSSTQLSRAYRGFFFDNLDAGISRVAVNNGDTITLMKLAWIFLKTDGTLAVSYTNPHVAYKQPVSPGTGDYWYDLNVKKWKTYNGTTFLVANALLIGACIQSTTGTVAARSFDFYANVNRTNTVVVAMPDIPRGDQIGSKINVYGKFIQFDKDAPSWDSATDMDTGVTLVANTAYYLYVTDQGDRVISDVPPYDRKDLMGKYHPFKPWRAVATVSTNGGATFDSNTLVNYFEGQKISGSDINDFSITGNKLVAPVSATSASCGSSGSSSANDITNLTVTVNLTTSRPVMISLIPDGTQDSGVGNAAQLGVSYTSGGTTGILQVYRDGAQIDSQVVVTANANGTASGTVGVPPSSYRVIDPSPSVGSHTYKIRGFVNNPGFLFVTYCKLYLVQL